jgi:hypothetical protein
MAPEESWAEPPFGADPVTRGLAAAGESMQRMIQAGAAKPRAKAVRKLNGHLLVWRHRREGIGPVDPSYIPV